jgi:hypothetical protein
MNKKPAHIETAMKNLRQEAHQRVLERGLVQFRLDEDYMQELLATADVKGLGYGVLARMWLCERLEQEKQKNPTTNQENVISNIRSIVRQEIKAALKIPQQKNRAV